MEIILKNQRNDALHYFSKSLANATAQAIKGNAIQTNSGREFTRLAATSQQTDTHTHTKTLLLLLEYTVCNTLQRSLRIPKMIIGKM